jgi:single-strand DNA-binding protein
MSLNKVMLIGNVGKDPEVRHLESGVVTASFTIATTERYKDRNGEMKDQTEWHNIVCWRSLAEIVEKYVKKGTQLYIEGKIKSRSYNDKDGITRYVTEIVADSLQMLGRKSDNQGSYAPQTPSQRPAAVNPYQQPAPAQNIAPSEPETASEDDGGDDLPF